MKKKSILSTTYHSGGRAEWTGVTGVLPACTPPAPVALRWGAEW